MTFYCGFDPTADSLHVGSMLPLLVMARLQKAGHRPIAVVGSGTGMIGDPSGKSQERKLLSDEEIVHNVAGIERQIGLFLDSTGSNRFEILRNDTWLREMNCIEFLRDVGKHFSVNAMMIKDSVKTRLSDREQGISYTEFSYMLLQAYDFYWLYRNRGCLLQIGGSDQWGNITAGIDLIRRKEQSGTSPAYGLTIPLLTTAGGTKFGKTEQGNVWLDPSRTSPYRFYQYWLNTQDEDVLRFLRLFTDLPEEELSSLETSLREHPEKREAQGRLAELLTAIVHGETELANAKRAAQVLFGGSLRDVPAATLRDIFAEVPSVELPSSRLSSGLTIAELLQSVGAAQSKGEAKRLTEGGGIYLNGVRVSDALTPVTAEQALAEGLFVIRVGKKKYYLAALTNA